MKFLPLSATLVFLHVTFAVLHAQLTINITSIPAGTPPDDMMYIAGNFNNWNPNAFSMKHENGEWSFKVHLSAGKHLYKFIADGKWILDPHNKLWEQNEYGTGNSIIWLDK